MMPGAGRMVAQHLSDKVEFCRVQKSSVVRSDAATRMTGQFDLIGMLRSTTIEGLLFWRGNVSIIMQKNIKKSQERSE